MLNWSSIMRPFILKAEEQEIFMRHQRTVLQQNCTIIIAILIALFIFFLSACSSLKIKPWRYKR